MGMYSHFHVFNSTSIVIGTKICMGTSFCDVCHKAQSFGIISSQFYVSILIFVVTATKKATPTPLNSDFQENGKIIPGD